jgi:hypothetical protein
MVILFSKKQPRSVRTYEAILSSLKDPMIDLWYGNPLKIAVK